MINDCADLSTDNLLIGAIPYNLNTNYINSETIRYNIRIIKAVTIKGIISKSFHPEYKIHARKYPAQKDTETSISLFNTRLMCK